MSDDGKARPLSEPIVLSSTFAFGDTAGQARAASKRDDFLYTRWDNPTIAAVEKRLAALEGADRALLTSSGMAAIHVAIMACLRKGGPLLVQNEVYGGTHELVEAILAPMGVEVRRAGLEHLPEVAETLPPGATIYAEIPSNPTLRVVDLDALSEAAPEGARIIVDATFATPLNVRPLEHGATLVVHSATKYLGGHHDVIAGVIAGRGPVMEDAWYVRKLVGPILDPAAAWRIGRSLETLELRVTRQCENASRIADALHRHRGVTVVHHPSLPSHPDHELAARLMKHAGAVVSFEVAGGREGAARVMDRLCVFANAPSLGGVTSLATWPAGVSHVELTDAELQRAGIAGGLIRLAIGIEPADDLWADLRQALDAVSG